MGYSVGGLNAGAAIPMMRCLRLCLLLVAATLLVAPVAALADDGSIVSWGYDSDGQVSNTPAGTHYTAV
ncbi:MAG: hypothetical protein VB949_15745, partial [Pseudomonadales bacterium]